MVSDSIADLLTRIRNAQRIGQKVVHVDAYTMNRSILDVLKREGFIDTFLVRKGSKKVTHGKTAFDECEVHLKYYSTGEPLMRQIKRVSKPGCRVYTPAEEIPKVMNGLGIVILSTPAGVLSDREAKKRGIGGEVLAVVG